MKIAALLLIALLCTPLAKAQEAPRVPVFHRLLIFNQAEQLMAVKIKDRDLWVTPGWYQDDRLTIRQGLNALASSYGLDVSEPVLRGVFSLRLGDDQHLSTRLVYSAQTRSAHSTVPEGIEAIRWLSVDESLQLINLPHIRAQLEQIVSAPDVVWGGTQRMQRANGAASFTVEEEFYSLQGRPQ